MTNRDKLIQICAESMAQLNLNEQKHKDRFKEELKEIDNQSEYDYLIDLKNSGVTGKVNENNLFIAKLLGLCNDVDLSKPPAYSQGELPDVDVDYIGPVRDYLKNEWAPKTFGSDKVCNISNFSTFGIKSSLIDIARVYGEDHDEVQACTKQLEDKDENGEELTWDTALQISPQLNEYCKKYPEVYEAAQKISGRKRGRSKHAGGLIISNICIDQLVPLMVDEDGLPISAWTEGQESQDLQPVGLIKYDLLSITNLMQIALGCKLVKERHNLKSICALPGHSDWSDISYLNDAASLVLANNSNLKCVFQFVSDGMRKLIKRGGVNSFDDLVAYVALYRPGPLGMKMHEAYVNRKLGLESYEIPEILQPYLSSTYGVMTFQEQIHRVLNLVGNIPLKDCELIRKAISKKKSEFFGKYKTMFIENGQKTLKWSKEKVENLWDQVDAFSGYGFNKSLTKDTIINTRNGPKKIQNFHAGDFVLSVNELGQTIETEVLACHDHGILDGFEVTFDDGFKVICTLDHKFLTSEGQTPLWKILKHSMSVFCDAKIGEIYAQDKKMAMDIEMRPKTQNTPKNAITSTQMSQMSKNNYREVEQNIEMWKDICKQSTSVGSSSSLQEMQNISLEAFRSEIYDSLRKGVQLETTERKSSKKLFKMSDDKKNQYCRTNEKTQQRQFNSRTKSYIFCNGKKNISPTRNPESTIRDIKKMAFGKSRQVCKNYDGCSKEPKTFQNGNLVKKRIELGRFLYTLWQTKKTGGFGQRESLDRGRWLFSFLRSEGDQKNIQKSISKYSTTRLDVKYGSSGSQKYNTYTYKYGMLLPFWFYESGLGESFSSNAQIQNTRGLVSRKIVRVLPVGKRQMYDLEVANPTHNFVLPSGIITSNSHSVSYCYVSARLLWLKTYYPIEFFTAILSCETKYDKIRDHKLECEANGVKIQKIDLNKSGVNFSIVDDKIYAGFSNLKGIGEAVAKNIVKDQPYSSLDDFLTKFGTNSTVAQRLICLGLFGDNRKELYEYYEYYRDEMKRREDRNKRNAITRQKHLDALESLGLSLEIASQTKEGAAIAKKYYKAIESFEEKVATDEVLTFETFQLKGVIDDEKIDKICDEDIGFAENLHYGFGWEHPLEKYPKFDKTMNFNRFKEEDDLLVAAIQCHVIEKPKKVVGKKGTVYYVVKLQDCLWNEVYMNVWSDDYERFQEEFEYWKSDVHKGHLMQLRVQAPWGTGNRYSFDAPKKHLRNKEIPTDKAKDYRLILLD